MGCNRFLTKEDDKLIEAAIRGENTGFSEERLREMEGILEKNQELFQRLGEEIEREEMAKEQADKEEKDPEYQKQLQESIELRIGKDHQLLIKGFNGSKIDNKETARIQTLLPLIVSQVTKELVYTGKLPELEIDKEGKSWITLEYWNVDHQGRATGKFYKHSPELIIGKPETFLSAEEKNLVKQAQMDTQLHWNFHTIYNLLFTDEDRVEVERICEERSQVSPGWEREISEYAWRMAREGRNDEVFCEFGAQFMTDLGRKEPGKLTKLEKANPELYNFIKDRLERLNRLSQFLGLKAEIGGENELSKSTN